MHTLQDANRSSFSNHWRKLLYIPPMSSSCPTAPLLAPSLSLKTISLESGTVLTRCHKGGYPANSFNPNTGKHIAIPEEGARFNPFLALQPRRFQLFMPQTPLRQRHWTFARDILNREAHLVALALPNMFATGALYGIGRPRFGQLLLADRTRFGHHVRHK